MKEDVQKVTRSERLITTVTIVVLMLVAFWFYLGDLQRLRGEEVIGTYPSPSGKYILTTYLNSGNLTVDFAVLGRVENTSTHRVRNIYWKYHCNVSTVRWIDEHTVVINDVILDVREEAYRNSDYDTGYLVFSGK